MEKEPDLLVLRKIFYLMLAEKHFHTAFISVDDCISDDFVLDISPS